MGKGLRVPQRTQSGLLIPGFYDTFTRADGAAGSTEAVNADGGSAPVIPWSAGAISSNALVITPTLGSELAAGNLVVGKWYSITASQVDHFYTGSAIGDTFRAAATTALDANNKVKEIDLASMLAGPNSVMPADTVTDITVKGLTSKTQCGGFARVNSLVAPTSGIFHNFDGSGNIKISEFTAATTWNPLATVAKAFAAGDMLRLHLLGTAWRLYHLTGTTWVLIGSGTTNVTAAGYSGAMSTAATNTIEAIDCHPCGSGNEFSVLGTV